MSRDQRFAAAATAAVLVGLAFGFHDAGTPATQRLANLDRARVEDLNVISVAVQGHYAAFGKLPVTLVGLENGNDFRFRDPDTRLAYEYRPLDERRFELCAVFSTDNRKEGNRSTLTPIHGVGRQCFSYPK